MSRAADAIGLAALRAPARRERPQPESPKRNAEKPRRRRVHLNLGKFAFTAVVLYLVGTGIAGEVQLLGVQAQEAAAVRALHALSVRNRSLQQEVRYYRTPAGEQAAIRNILHYAPKGETPIQFSAP